MSSLPHRKETAWSSTDLAAIDELISRRAWDTVKQAIDDYSIRHKPSEDSINGAILELYRATVSFYAGEYREALQSGRNALTVLHVSSEHSRLGQTLTMMGRSYAAIGDLRNARIFVRDALSAFRRDDDQSGLCEASNELARIYFIRGEYDNALEFLQEASACAHRAGDYVRETAILGNWGRTLLLMGEWPGAEERLNSALESAQRANNPLSQSRNLLSLAYLEIVRGRADEASDYLEKAGAIISANNFIREKAIYHEYVGHWHLMTNHPVAAREAFRETLSIGKRIAPNSSLVSQACRGLAECAWMQNDLTELEHWIEDGLNVALPLGERAEVAYLYRLRGRLLCARGTFAEAQEYFDKSLEILEKCGDVYEIAVTRRILGESLSTSEAREDSEVSGGALRTALGTFENLDAHVQQIETSILLARWEQKEGRTDEALTRLRALGKLSSNSAPNKRESIRAAIADLERAMVLHSISELNELSLFRTHAQNGKSNNGERQHGDLQSALEHLATKIGAERVLLIEFTQSVDSSAETVLSKGSDSAYDRRVAQLVGSDFQELIPAAEPRVFLDTRLMPKLQSYLTLSNHDLPGSLITVPIALGEGGHGMLYCDRVVNGVGLRSFSQADLDYAVAFADVIAWRMTQLRSARLVRDNKRLLKQLQSNCAFPNIITTSEVMHDLLARVQLVVDSDIAVLIEGETGVGKDLLARAIHYSSRRKDGRFVSVNCAALPESLMESELFGARKGAYTGADRDKVGLFEEANGGTFFLDEIGEMPLSIQAKVLRLLETKEVVRLGDVKPRKVDVRIISATNRNLEHDTNQQSFRQDLYFRLAPITFKVPALRERREDIPLLIEHFRSRIPDAHSVRFAAETVRRMSNYDWPGNARELENEVKKMILLRGDTEIIGPDLLAGKFSSHVQVKNPAKDLNLGDEPFSLYDHIADIERQFIIQALKKNKSVKKHAAEYLGMPESTLRLKMKQYGIEMS